MSQILFYFTDNEIKTQKQKQPEYPTEKWMNNFLNKC